MTATIAGKQRKKQFSDLTDAEHCQTQWEVERIGQLAAMRPKMTRLTAAQIAEAESAIQFLRPTGYILVEAAKYMIRFAPTLLAPDVGPRGVLFSRPR